MKCCEKRYCSRTGTFLLAFAVGNVQLNLSGRVGSSDGLAIFSKTSIKGASRVIVNGSIDLLALCSNELLRGKIGIYIAGI